MQYGIILGIAVILGALFGDLWTWVVVGLLVDLLLFLWLRYGAWIRAIPARAAWAWGGAVAVGGFFRRYWGWIALLLLLLLVWTFLATSPTITPRGGVRGVIADVKYRKTLVFEKSDLLDTKLCGVRPGTRTFEVSGKRVEVFLTKSGFPPERSDITSFLLVNGTIEGEPFEVADDGCVTVSTSHPKVVRASNTFIPQRIALTFK